MTNPLYTGRARSLYCPLPLLCLLCRHDESAACTSRVSQTRLSRRTTRHNSVRQDADNSIIGASLHTRLLHSAHAQKSRLAQSSARRDGMLKGEREREMSTLQNSAIRMQRERRKMGMCVCVCECDGAGTTRECVANCSRLLIQLGGRRSDVFLTAMSLLWLLSIVSMRVGVTYVYRRCRLCM